MWWEERRVHRLRAPPLAYGYRQKWAAAHRWARAPPLAHRAVGALLPHEASLISSLILCYLPQNSFVFLRKNLYATKKIFLSVLCCSRAKICGICVRFNSGSELGVSQIQNRADVSSASAKYRNLPQLYKPSQTLSNHIKPSQTSLP